VQVAKDAAGDAGEATADPAGVSLGWRLIGTAGAVVAVMATRKVLAKVWTKATGSPPPDDPSHPDVTTASALTWVVASTLGVSVAKLAVRRAAGHRWATATGHSAPEPVAVRA
jgi:hypothetical protein